MSLAAIDPIAFSTGPQVMNDITNKKSCQMLTETYSAIIGTNYNVIASGKTSFELFHWKSIFRDPVNGRRNYC